MSWSQKALLTPSLLVFNITANIINTAVSVKIVPPTVMATACCDTIPHRLTMGYEIKVWVEHACHKEARLKIKFKQVKTNRKTYK